MVVASTPVDNIGIPNSTLIVETHENCDHYVVEPVTQRRIPLYTLENSHPTWAHAQAVEWMQDASFCRGIHNRICELT